MKLDESAKQLLSNSYTNGELNTYTYLKETETRFKTNENMLVLPFDYMQYLHFSLITVPYHIFFILHS